VILAAIEISKRYLIDSEMPIIDTPEKAVEQLTDIRGKKQEHFVCLTLEGDTVIELYLVKPRVFAAIHYHPYYCFPFLSMQSFFTLVTV